jgi:hypothetical protein
MLETVSNVIKFVTSMQLHNGCNFSFKGAPFKCFALRHVPVFGMPAFMVRGSAGLSPSQRCGEAATQD